MIFSMILVLLIIGCGFWVLAEWLWSGRLNFFNKTIERKQNPAGFWIRWFCFLIPLVAVLFFAVGFYQKVGSVSRELMPPDQLQR
jgi:O-antigen/teichoic acid export membrane protein